MYGKETESRKILYVLKPFLAETLIPQGAYVMQAFAGPVALYRYF